MQLSMIFTPWFPRMGKRVPSSTFLFTALFLVLVFVSVQIFILEIASAHFDESIFDHSKCATICAGQSEPQRETSNQRAGEAAEVRPPPIYASDTSKSIICHNLKPFGRLGNDLFQYAAILGLSHMNGMGFYIGNDQRLRGVLRSLPVYGNRTELEQRCSRAKRTVNAKDCAYDPRLTRLAPDHDYVIDGYLQSWVYFAHVQHQVRAALVFTDAIVRRAEHVVKQIRRTQGNTTLVGVHVRRGDLLKTRQARDGYVTAPVQFFHKAMTYFRRRFGHVTFVVASDDTLWCRQNLLSSENGGDVIVLERNLPAVDMQILAMTDHVIRSVGTFGWWAAYLNQGTVVYYKNFIRPGSRFQSFHTDTATDFIYPGWIPM